MLIRPSHRTTRPDCGMQFPKDEGEKKIVGSRSPLVQVGGTNGVSTDTVYFNFDDTASCPVRHRLTPLLRLSPPWPRPPSHSTSPLRPPSTAVQQGWAFAFGQAAFTVYSPTDVLVRHFVREPAVKMDPGFVRTVTGLATQRVQRNVRLLSVIPSILEPDCSRVSGTGSGKGRSARDWVVLPPDVGSTPFLQGLCVLNTDARHMRCPVTCLAWSTIAWSLSWSLTWSLAGSLTWSQWRILL